MYAKPRASLFEYEGRQPGYRKWWTLMLYGTDNQSAKFRTRAHECLRSGKATALCA